MSNIWLDEEQKLFAVYRKKKIEGRDQTGQAQLHCLTILQVICFLKLCSETHKCHSC